MSEEFQTENGDRYVVDGRILEVWSWVGQSQSRIRLDMIDSVEYKGKWGTHMIQLQKSGAETYNIITAGDRSEELAAWIEAARVAAN